MAVQSTSTLKGYFETGDTPTEAQFVNLIDSTVSNNGEASNLSGSAAGTGSFGSLVVAGNLTTNTSSVVLKDLPTSEPVAAKGITGSLWLSGSNGGPGTRSKYVVCYVGS